MSTTNNAAANQAAATHQAKIGAVLNALAVLAAELGPLWFHSEHGQATLAASVKTIAIAGAVESNLGQQTLS